LCVGGYASADSAEEHGGTTGFARGAPLYRIRPWEHRVAEQIRRSIDG